MSNEQKNVGLLGKSVTLPGDLATLERNVIAQVECSASKIENCIDTLAKAFNRTKWMAGTLLVLAMVMLATVLLRRVNSI